MAETIVDGTQINFSEIVYRAAKVMAQGGKNIRIANKSTQSVYRLSTPVMLTWGASDYVEPGAEKGNGKYEMSLQFPQEEYRTPETTAFLENMKKFQDKIRDDAFRLSKEWFGKQHKSLDIIDELFTPMLKYPKIKGTSEPDYSKNPTLRIKVPCYDGVWKVELYDENSEKLYPSVDLPHASPLDYLVKGTNVACIIQCAGIWLTNGKFSVSWQLVQAMVQKPRETILGKCLIKINPKEKEILSKKQVTAEEEEDPTVTNIEVVDSDEEDDETIKPVKNVAVEQFVPQPEQQEEVDEPPPTPTPEPVKKKVVKKKLTNVDA